jgi:hypothetical protein
MNSPVLRDGDVRFSFAFIGFVVVMSVTLWPTKTTSAVAKRGSRVNGAIQDYQRLSPRAKGRILAQRLHYPDQPVEITEVKANGKTTKLNERIEADANGEWFNGLSFKIKNISDRRIVSIDVFLVFPETESAGLLVAPMHYGANPPGAKHPGKGDPLEPNDTVDFGITPELYAYLKPHIESRIPLKDVNHVQVSLELIVFDDDTAWGSGQRMRRDPTNPRRWLPIE